MNAERKRVLVLLTIGAVALVVLWRLPGRKSVESTTPATSGVTTAAPQLTPPTSRVVSADSIAAIRRSSWGADPFRGRVVQGSTESTDNPLWVCRGILFSEQTPMAYVNDRLIKVGDQVDLAQVVAIERHRVVLEYRGVRINLTVTRG